MAMIVLTKSSSFSNFIKDVVGNDCDCFSEVPTMLSKENSYLIHATSMSGYYEKWLSQQSNKQDVKIIICSDKPTLVEMVEMVDLGAKAYCNSYMQAQNYQQMLRLVGEGESWFPPQMLYETFKLAGQLLSTKDVDNSLSELTKKEKEISLAVGEGHTNLQVAELLKITESTVKTHLTHIYKKLGIKDRVGLVLYMKSPH